MLRIYAFLALAGAAQAQELTGAYLDLLQRVSASKAGWRAAVQAADGLPPAYQTPKALAKDAVGSGGRCLNASLEGDPGLTYCVNEAEYHGFNLTNRGSARINPLGGAVHREYKFYSDRNARQETGLTVYEWGSPNEGASDSAWSMMTEILFFPRKVTPAVAPARGGTALEVTLPTGETVLFDAKTKEVLTGALEETFPIDSRQDRFTRKFAGLKYKGKGIMVRSDQRGESPRSSEVWGRKLTATIVWGEKTCRVSPADVWEQDPQEGGGKGLYADDEGFYAMLRRKCGWKVDSL